MNPGDPASASKGVPRLVGATTPAATRRAAALLGTINDNVLELSSPDAAELAKLLENVFRNVNIALVNQLALLCERMGLDVWEVIDAAATKPFGFMRFTPGPGVGGHCIPVDPYYLAWRAREFDFVDRFVELAGDINLAMPRHVVDLVAEALNDRGKALRGARVGVLGVAFKPNVRDARNSPAAEVISRPPRPRRRRRLPRPPRADVPRRRRRRPTSPSLSTSCSRQRRGRRRHGPRAIDFDAVYERARPRRRHRQQLARPRRPAAPGAPARRRLERRLSTTAGERRGRPGTPRPVAMLVHSYYDEDPRVRREAESLVAAGPAGRRLRAAPRRRPAAGRGRRASPSIGSTSSATRAPASRTYLAEYLAFLVRAGVGR